MQGASLLQGRPSWAVGRAPCMSHSGHEPGHEPARCSWPAHPRLQHGNRGYRSRDGAALKPPKAGTDGGGPPAAPSASTAPAAQPVDEEGGPPDVEALLSKAVNLVATSNQLVPYTPDVSVALVIWRAIREVPEQHRPRLLGMLNAGAIKKLWQVAGERYFAPARQVALAIGPDYSVWEDLPTSPEQIVHFRGRAALPPLALGLKGFTLSAFLHPGTEEPYGRLALLPLGLGDLVWPLYCRLGVGQEMVPGTEELCDLVLHFPPPDRLGLDPDDLPRSAWPRPRPPRPPFDQGFTGFVRAAGPGVYVGKGVRTLAEGPEEPLFFLLARQRAESLLG